MNWLSKIEGKRIQFRLQKGIYTISYLFNQEF